METRDKLIILAEIALLLASFSSYQESNIVENNNDLQRDALSQIQTASIDILRANRFCDKYYEVANYRDGNFYPRDADEVTFEDMARAMNKRNITVDDLSNDTFVSELQNWTVFVAAERRSSFKFYTKCKDLESNATKALEAANSNYVEIFNQSEKKYWSILHKLNLVLAFSLLSLALVLDSLTEKYREIISKLGY